MKRVAVALPVIVLVFTTVTAAPVPTHLFPKTPPLYFPTTIGTTWVYEEPDQMLTLTIASVEQVKGGKLVTVERVPRELRIKDATVLVSASGLVRAESFGLKLDPPLVLLKLPSKPGDTWALSDPEGTSTIRGVEEVKVPAGTYEAIRVDFDYTLGGQKKQTSFWYAADVGLVKVTSGKDRFQQILKSFTRGKE